MIPRGLIRRVLVVSLQVGLLQLVLMPVAIATPGDPDATFSGDGKVTTRFAGDAEGWAVAIQPDGKIVVAGNATLTARSLTQKFAVARYTPIGCSTTASVGTARWEPRLLAMLAPSGWPSNRMARSCLVCNGNGGNRSHRVPLAEALSEGLYTASVSASNGRESVTAAARLTVH